MPYTQLNNLDFNEIKIALKDYLRAQSEFTDYDFEGSTLSQLLDVLAYNTYYTAFNTNMVVNELFLDSATLRDNVVALAKQLGYTPKSITTPTAAVDFNISFPSNAPSAVILKAGSGFITNYDNGTYRYIVRSDERAEVINGTASFSGISIHEGSLITTRTTVDAMIANAADINAIRGQTECLLWHQQLGHPSDERSCTAHEFIDGVPQFENHDPVLKKWATCIQSK